jgi:hypothetical protein
MTTVIAASDRVEEALVCVGVKLQSGHCADDAGIEAAVKESESHHFVVQVRDGTKESNGPGGFRERRVAGVNCFVVLQNGKSRDRHF